MEDDAQGQGYILRPDRIFLESGPMNRSPRSHATPAWVSNPNFARRATGRAPQAATAHRPSSSKCARFDATSEDASLGLQQVTGRSRSGKECAICLNDFRADETLRAMPCSHAFHHHCISEWLRRNAVCPLCRHRLTTAPTPEVEEEEVAPEVEEEEVEWVDGAGESS